MWGEEEELDGPFEVVAINKETGEEIIVVEERELAGANNGADAHIPSQMGLPSSGIWQMKAFVGGELFGTVVVEVG
ncbi:hypothetical protein ABFG93_05200 [Pseudalkalibacillus hwajinpoensis]|uniref:hypothetical protein n=1 Tax=Guptibacillus hwajinpoensis TaxID=208199 RepID=UPI00325ADA34